MIQRTVVLLGCRAVQCSSLHRRERSTLHWNSGCEGRRVGIAEKRLGLPKGNFKVMTDEGNMGVELEFDEKAGEKRIGVCVRATT